MLENALLFGKSWKFAPALKALLLSPDGLELLGALPLDPQIVLFLFNLCVTFGYFLDFSASLKLRPIISYST